MGVDNATVARRYMTEIWGKGDLDVVDELVAPEIVLRDPLSPEVRGIEAVRERVRDMTATFSNGSITIDEIIVSGDRAVVCHTWRGVHRGELFGVPGTGRTLTVKVVELLRIEGGKVVENTSYFDAYGMIQQLGVLPPPDQLAGALKSGTVSAARANAPQG